MSNTRIHCLSVLALGSVALAQSGPKPLSPSCDCLLRGGSLMIIDLSQPGFAEYGIDGLNNSGQVLMRMAQRAGDTATGFVWRDGDVTPLRVPPASAVGVFELPLGEAINDAGTIAGHVAGPGGRSAAVWSSVMDEGTVHYREGQDPATEAPAPALYFGISPNGTPAGYTSDPILGQAIRNVSGSEFFEVLERRSPGSVCTEAGYGVDDRGVVVGFSDDPTTGGCGVQATIWGPDGRPTIVLDTSFGSRANAINAAGQVAVSGGIGYVINLALGTPPIELGQLSPQDINAAGVVAGHWPFGNEGRMWFDGHYVRLIDRVDPAEGWTALGAVEAINAACWMVGLGTKDGVEGVPYLVMPGGDCAEPCPVDLDGDGEATLFDFLAFQNLFAMGDLAADFDGDGDLTLFDFLAFQNAFDLDCP